MPREKLATYLTDHFAGSQAALEIIEKIEASYPESPAAAVVSAILPELLMERDVLRQLLEQLDSSPSNARRALGWLSEKLMDLKLRMDDPELGGLRLLESLEVLLIGISGKIALWNALASAKSVQPLLAAVDFEELLRMAHSQHARVDAQRIAAAVHTFSETQ